MKKNVFGLFFISSFLMITACSDDFVSDTTVSNSGLEIASEVKSLQVTNDFLKSLKFKTSGNPVINSISASFFISRESH